VASLDASDDVIIPELTRRIPAALDVNLTVVIVVMYSLVI
jgi:hypothetical protein